MRWPWLPRSIRLRMSLWHASSLALVLIAYSAFVFLFVRKQLFEGLDQLLHEDFEIAEEMLTRDTDGRLTWGRSLYRHDENGPGPLRSIEVWQDGELQLRIPEMAAGRFAPLPPPGQTSTPMYVSVELPGDLHVRVFQDSHEVGGRPVIIRAVRSEEGLNQELGVLAAVLIAGLPAGLIIAAAGGYLIARRALAAIGHMTSHARRISANKLQERLPVGNPGDELGQLAVTFNETFSRLERSFEQLRQFTADASHELRTPLTAIRTVGEVALRESRTPEQYQEVIASLLEEADHLTRLVDSLLLLSRADRGSLPMALAEVNLAALASDVAEHLRVLAEEKNQRILVETGTEDIRAWGDWTLLRQAAINLVDNAVKHGWPGKVIRISVRRDGPRPVLEVADEGPGIVPEHQPFVFDRFYRVNQSRSRESGGFGLGLSLARLAVERQGGRIELRSVAGKGSTFRIVLLSPRVGATGGPQGPHPQRRNQS